METFKVVLVGDTGVGKSTLLKMFVTRQFDKGYLPTVGVNIQNLTFRKQDESVRLKVWDCAGQERLGGIRTPYYEGAQAAIIMYSCESPSSVKCLPFWISEVEANCGDIPIIIIANKRDISTGQFYMGPERKGHYLISVKDNEFMVPFNRLVKLLKKSL